MASHENKRRQDAAQDPSSGSEQGEAGSDSESESYTDLDTEPEITDPIDSEGEELRKSIAYHKAQGRAKSKRSDWSNDLVSREFDFWKAFCRKVKADPEAILRMREAATFKAYLEWRVKNFRIKKESTIKAYWRRMLCKYIDVSGHSMNNGAELDIQDWIPTYLTPTYNLNTSEKEKHAMYVTELYAVLHAHWAMDPKPCHGRLRVEISAILLISGATATRPGALVESGSAKNSNKALAYEHISIMRVRDAKEETKTTTVAIVSLVHVKNSGGKGRRKKFVFRLESIPGFCIVSHLVALAIADDAFRRHFTSIEQIFDLEIPAHKDCLKLKFRKEMDHRPIFRRVERKLGMTTVSDIQALQYKTCRDKLVWLGRVLGFEHSLEWYQVRRGSGRNLNRTLRTEERNQTMGHRGTTYEQFYLPDLIERDFQSIYFGTPAQDELIQQVARMGLSRDEHAPIELSNEQKAEVLGNPELVELCKKRDSYRERIKARQYTIVDAAKGTGLHDKYEATKREIRSLKSTLMSRRLDQAIKDFHESIDDRYIDSQLDGQKLKQSPRPDTRYEFRERATIVKLLSRPLSDLDEAQAMKLRIKFIHNLARYCEQQENRDLNSRTELALRPSTQNWDSPMDRKRHLSDPEGSEPRKRHSPSPQESPQHTSIIKKEAEDEEVVELDQKPSSPMKFDSLVCLVCLANKEQRIRSFAKKYTLQKHIDKHAADGVFDTDFQCGDVNCSIWISGICHYMNHAGSVHGVWHQVKRVK